jgi:hypothetical protein
LRASQEGVQSLRGQLTEAVIVRQQRDREASESLGISRRSSGRSSVSPTR